MSDEPAHTTPGPQEEAARESLGSAPGRSKSAHVVVEYRPFTLTQLDVPKAKSQPSSRDLSKTSPPAREDMEKTAAQLIEEAKSRGEEIEREAYEQGFSQGEKDGHEIGAMKLDKILNRIENISRDLESYQQEFARQHEKEILHLIAAIAAKVTRTVVDLDKEVVKSAVMEALKAAAEWQEVTIRVDPADFEFLEEMRPAFFEKLGQLRSINIVADPSVEKGGCIVNADFGEVDARIQPRLEKVSQALMEAYGSKRI